jgi:hypothetical protein
MRWVLGVAAAKSTETALRAGELVRISSGSFEPFRGSCNASHPQRARSADQAEDQAWSALHDWLVGWSKVPNATANQARAIHDTLFPAGLKFTRLPYKLEWAEADARLSRITTDKLDTQIEQLGGKPILDQLRAAHQAYGEALGITAETQDNTVGLREPLKQFTAALRA